VEHGAAAQIEVNFQIANGEQRIRRLHQRLPLQSDTTIDDSALVRQTEGIRFDRCPVRGRSGWRMGSRWANVRDPAAVRESDRDRLRKSDPAPNEAVLSYRDCRVSQKAPRSAHVRKSFRHTSR